MIFFRLSKTLRSNGNNCVKVTAGILLFCITGCKSEYKNLQPVSGDPHCIEKFAPQFSHTLYNAFVDVTTHHLSGILYLKLMPDSSMRIVFANEMGVKFFDFGFAKDHRFTKYYVLPKMDKKIIVNALSKDMELALVRPDLHEAETWQRDSLRYTGVADKRGHDYYVTDNRCSRLLRIEKASRRKPVEDIQLFNYNNGIPDSMDILHKNFKFHIALKLVEK